MTLPRYFLLLAVPFLYSSLVYSQDKIYLPNSVIQGKITEINPTEIKYWPLEKPGSTLILPASKALLLINGRGMVLVPPKQTPETQAMKDLIARFLGPDTNRVARDQFYLLPGSKTEGTITKEDKYFFYLSDGTTIAKKTLAALIYSNGQSMIYCTTDQAAQLFDSLQQKTLQSAASTVSFTQPESVSSPTLMKTDTSPPRNESGTSPIPSPDSTGTTSFVSGDTAGNGQSSSTDSSKDLQFSTVAPNVPKKEFEEKAEKKTTQFTEYLKILCDKTANYEEINKAVGQAITLFVNEGAMIETSSNNRNTISRLKIRDYLNKVKMIQYDKIEIEWTHVQYVSDLKPGPDGNFYGVVSFEQVFRGYRDGKLVYSDITRKNATVVLKTYQKNQEGTTRNIWDVLLSDVGVISTKSL